MGADCVLALNWALAKVFSYAILVDSTDRCRALVVIADVANKLASEILFGSEDASRNVIALNLGKPYFDLVDPAGVCRGLSVQSAGFKQSAALS
jgi:hypothetical protein